MRRAPAILVGCAVLLLAGCAPDTSEAYSHCVETLTAPYESDNLPPDEYIEKATDVADYCLKYSLSEPEMFVEEWG